MKDESSKITAIIQSPFGSQFGDWFKGKIGKYEFEAKVFDEGSKYGINNGRISKLMIWDTEIRKQTNDINKACIANYDRGWNIKPQKAQEKQVLSTVLKQLDGYKKSLLSKVAEKKKEADALSTSSKTPQKSKKQEL